MANMNCYYMVNDGLYIYIYGWWLIILSDVNHYSNHVLI